MTTELDLDGPDFTFGADEKETDPEKFPIWTLHVWRHETAEKMAKEIRDCLKDEDLHHKVDGPYVVTERNGTKSIQIRMQKKTAKKVANMIGVQKVECNWAKTKIG